MAEREFYSGKILYPAIVALLALSVLFAFAILPRMIPAHSALVGKAAPDFSLEIVHNGGPGDRVHLAELKGHPVLLDFWATWCGPCQAQAPVVDRIARRLHGRGLVVVGVNTDDPNGRGLAPRFATQRGLSYPIVYDADNDVGARYGVSTLPTVVVIGREGNVIAVRSGYEDDAALDELVGEAL